MAREEQSKPKSARKHGQSLDFEKLSKSDRKLFAETGRLAMTEIALQEMGRNRFDAAAYTDPELKQKIAEHIEKVLTTQKIKIVLRIDHTQDLLREARSRLQRKQYDLAALFFSTFFEHKINSMLVELCERKNIPNSVIKTIIRESSLTAKCTWLLQILNSRSIGKIWVTRVNGIAEVRNAFVHYKWPNTPDDPRADINAEKIDKLKHAEAIVRALRRYEEHNVHFRQGNRVRRALKR